MEVCSMGRIPRSLAVLGAVVALGAAGCADVDQGQAVRSLQAQVESLERQNQDYAGQVAAYQAQVDQQQREALLQREEYRKALASPGYEAALRLVYADLQAGSTESPTWIWRPMRSGR
jgi:cell division protein FtsB